METLADIPDSQVIYAVCDPCGRFEPFNIRKLDQGMTLGDLRRRLKCDRCGRRAEIRRVHTQSQAIR